MSEPARELLPEENQPETTAQEGAAELPQAETIPAEAAPMETIAGAEDGQIHLPMAWHAFLCRFWVWLEALLHIAQLAWFASGRAYYGWEIQKSVYDGMPWMMLADGFLALGLAVGAILLVCAGACLCRRKRSGVRQLKAAYGVLLVGTVGYALLRFIIAGLSPLSIPLIAQALAYALLLGMNAVYYHRRSSGFGKG